MESPQSTERSEKKKLTKQEQLQEETEKFMQRPTLQIANPNKDLKKAYGTAYLKDKKFDHIRHLKKIRNKTEKDSISSDIEDDQEFDIEKQKRRIRKRKNQDDQKPKKERGRKPKNSPEKMNADAPKQIAVGQQTNNEAPVVRRRGRPKGSLNKNKRQNEKKQEQKKPKQFECLKKIEVEQKEASSLQDESQSQSEQQADMKNAQGISKEAEKIPETKQVDNKAVAQKQAENKEQAEPSESSQESEESQESQQKKPIKEQKKEQDSQEQQESQVSSQNQNEPVSVPLKPALPNQQKIAQRYKMEQSVAPVRGKKLNINSSSPSPSDTSQQKIKGNIANKQNVKDDNQQSKTPAQQMVSQELLLPQQQELRQIHKKRGRKSNETQLRIQELQEIIYKKKNNIAIFQNKKQKSDLLLTVQINRDESQSYHKQTNQARKKPRIISSMYHGRKNNEEKPQEDKMGGQPKVQQNVSKKPIQNTVAVIDRKQVQRQIMQQKVKKLGIQSKIYSEGILHQEPIDPQQQKLFRGWTKYYKKFNQAVVAQEQQEEVQNATSHRKKPAKQKFVRYRKVIIQESSDDYSEDHHRQSKKMRKQKRSKEPVIVVHEKKSKSKRKHRDTSSSGQGYN